METCTCDQCGQEVECDNVEYSGSYCYCIYCIEASDKAQDERDNSSCYSVTY